MRFSILDFGFAIGRFGRAPAILAPIFAFLFALCHSVEAQQPVKMPRVGFVSGTGELNNPGPFVDAFRRGLSDLGYAEGKNIHIEYRYVHGRADRAAEFVHELIDLGIDVIVSSEGAAVRAAKKAIKAIPLVMVINGDPVASGYVDSLARPGGNITGLTRLNRELSGKRIELLKEVIPGLSKIGILFSASSGSLANSFKEY